MNYRNRIDKLFDILDEKNIESALITSPENCMYFSGFTGSAGYLLLTRQSRRLFTDFRYTEQASGQAKDYEIIKVSAKTSMALKEAVEKEGVKNIGFESNRLTYARYAELKESLADVEMVPLEGIIEDIRAVKDASEMRYIKKAAEIADRTFEHILKMIRPGVTENDIASEMEFFMRKNGASRNSFETIVASGERSSLPHGTASQKKVEIDDAVVIDFGAVYEGYCSDMTRTVFLGNNSDGKLKKIYNVVREAQNIALEKITPGMYCKDADKIARDVIQKYGYGDFFGHGLGHGVGIEVHENPRLAPSVEEVLEEGAVVTVEPGIYIPGLGGVRIEDMVMVTATGVEVLTKSPKDLICL